MSKRSEQELRDVMARCLQLAEVEIAKHKEPPFHIEAIRDFLKNAIGPVIPDISAENFWREVWHVNCPVNARTIGAGGCGPMKRLSETLAIEDGSILDAYECVSCRVRVYAGLDKSRRIVRRPYAQDKNQVKEKA